MDKCKYLILLSIMFLLSACVPYDTQEADRSRISVVSFEENWPKLQEKALEWQADAHLLGATLPISVDSYNPRESNIYAHFLSNSEPGTMLEIVLNPDGEMRVEFVSITPLENAKPILRADWAIDSRDALDSLLEDDDVKFLISHSDRQCSDLNLQRKPQINAKPVIWRILVVDCRISEYNHDESIDAVSGEIR
jgi:hypothetical protein